jgi:hypothetical protein
VIVAVVEIKKADVEQQVVFGEVFAPGVIDSQGDCMTAEEIQKTAYLFMEKGRLSKIDTNHDLQANGSYVVENFIARDGDPTFIPGSWVVGVKVPDANVWAKIKKGELNGFSFDGVGFREPTTLQVEIPEKLSGLSDQVNDHAHQFVVKFDPATGAFLGGETDEVAGHSHKIVKGTLTEEVDGHTHRFSFVEGMLDAH